MRSPNSTHSWYWYPWRSVHQYKYENAYRLTDFEAAETEYFESIFFEEYVFLCPHRRHEHLLLPYYVSKEYHVGISPYPYMPGRFVIKPTARLVDVYLAEEPSIAYMSPVLNITTFKLENTMNVNQVTFICCIVPTGRVILF